MMAMERVQLRYFHLLQLILVTGVLCCLDPVASGVDKTLNEGATGSDVVNAVIAKLEASEIFDNDHRLLRRLAFVESADGVTDRTPCSNGGGIWALEESKLTIVLTSSELAATREKIRLFFNVEWTQVTIQDLCKPFYAGMTARLYLYYLETTTRARIPLAGNIAEQARFWFTYYHSQTQGLTVDYFIAQVSLLEEKEGCKVNMDIFFVLDGSGSIGSSNFEQVRQFEYDFVSNLAIGPNDNQVGTIVFSRVGTVIFSLDSYNNTRDLLSAIRAIYYPGDGTNTPDGLCKLLRYGFADGYGSRPSSAAVYRIAIVMTDGKSNVQSTECQWNTIQAAEAVHNETPPILVYVIGVTQSINQAELEAIATKSSYVTYLDSFNKNILQEAQESHTDEVCRKVSVPVSTDEEMNGTLDQNETVRYHFPIPVIGITVEVCTTVGHVIVYGSVSVPNPNSAFYDWFLELEHTLDDSQTEFCKSIFFDISTTSPTDNSDVSLPIPDAPTLTVTPQPSVVPGTGSTPPDSGELTGQVLYLAVVGKLNKNNFVLNATAGDTNPDADTDITSNATTVDNEDDEKTLIVVVAGSCGIVVVLLCVLLLTCSCICGYLCCCKKKTHRVDNYNLLPRGSDAVWVGEE